MTDTQDLLDTLRSMLLDIAEEDPGPTVSPPRRLWRRCNSWLDWHPTPTPLKDLAAKLKD
jgi:hypothetical protein